MMQIRRRRINWEKTGINLQLLRSDNLNLRRFCCRQLRYDSGNCSGECDSCIFEMDHSISRSELATVFNVSDNMIVNWESGKSKPTIEDLMLYADICGLDLFDIILFEEDE